MHFVFVALESFVCKIVLMDCRAVCMSVTYFHYWKLSGSSVIKVGRITEDGETEGLCVWVQETDTNKQKRTNKN